MYLIIKLHIKKKHLKRIPKPQRMNILTPMQKVLYKGINTAVTVGIRSPKVPNSAISAGKEWITKEKHIE